MNQKPWKNWIPGVLSNKQVRSLCRRGYIKNYSKDVTSFDYSAFDLHLSGDVYQMKNGSIKPSKDKYSTYLEDENLAVKIHSTKGSFELKRRKTYVVRIKEEFNHFEELKSACIHGQATAKSTIGRMDVLTRLIVDGMDEYELFKPECFADNRSDGKMYLEITPITFNVKIKEDISLSQLRLFYGKPEESQILDSKLLYKTTLHDSVNTESDDGTLSVDLNPIQIDGCSTSAFSAKKTNDVLQLWGKDEYSPNKYWKCESCIEITSHKRLVIKKGVFYILRSKEKISLPGSIAVYCRAMDETLGEMRIHYAGFVHPYFGFDRKDGGSGTPLIFEVRGHDVNVSLADNEKLAKLIFYRMSETVKMDIDYAPDYGKQTLKLSKIFRAF